ncbi:MAG: hypothetical protein KAI40_05855 [Desulfobacterales bacterium]|nr:hypothetical protein [Desulfobacterales bacterium]
MKYEPDKHDLDTVIADQLVKMGYDAIAGGKNQTLNKFDTTVSYENSWAWGVTEEFTTLKIQFKDVKTKEMIAYAENIKTEIVRVSDRMFDVELEDDQGIIAKSVYQIKTTSKYQGANQWNLQQCKSN